MGIDNVSSTEKVVGPVTPIPKLQLFLLCCVEMAEALNVQLLFPFLAFMIEDMGYTGEQLGYHAGLLAATFCGGQFCTSVAWGVISDKYGRKFAIVWGTMGSGLGMLIFGFSKTFAQAMLGRFLGGLLCGNMGVVKSSLTEITDDTNRSATFYLYSLAWTIGSICAPLVGGLLSKPAEKYPTVFTSDPSSIWVQFPYLLPCLLTVSFNLIVTIVCAIFMVETVGAKKDDNILVSSAQSTLHDEMESLEEGVQMSTVFAHTTLEAIPDRETATRGRSSSVQSADDSSIRARSHSTEKHNMVFNRTSKVERNAEYGRLAPSQEGYPPKNEVDFMPSDSTVTTTCSTIDRSCESISEEEDFSGNSPKVLNSEDPDEICCPTFFDCITEMGRTLGCIAKARGEDAGMDSSSHELMQSDSRGGLSTLESTASGKLSTGDILKQRAVLLATGTYGMVCASSILIDETLPLFFKLDTAHGGFGFDSTQIGTLLSSGAAGMMIMSILCIPLIDGVSNKYLSKMSIAVLAPLCLAFPFLALLNNSVLANMTSNTAHMWVLWPLLIVIQTFKNLFTNFSFTAAIIMVNYSVTDEYLGAVNGLGQSLGALARCMGPAVGGLLWGVATKCNFVYLNFIAITVVFAMNFYVSYIAPNSLDHRKIGKKL